MFGAGGTFALAGYTFDPNFFVPNTTSTTSCVANFAADCEDNGLDWCSDFEISIGSSAVDYTDPTAPVMDKIVGFGARGIGMFRLPSSASDPIEFVWDSVS